MSRRLTGKMVDVLRILAEGDEMWPREIGEALGFRFPRSVEVVRPTLRMLEFGSLVSVEHRSANRSHRAYYAITDDGRRALLERQAGEGE